MFFTVDISPHRVPIESPYVCLSDLFNLREDSDWPKLIHDRHHISSFNFFISITTNDTLRRAFIFKDLGTHMSKIVCLYKYLHSWYSNENTSHILNCINI